MQCCYKMMCVSIIVFMKPVFMLICDGVCSHDVVSHVLTCCVNVDVVWTWSTELLIVSTRLWLGVLPWLRGGLEHSGIAGPPQLFKAPAAWGTERRSKLLPLLGEKRGNYSWHRCSGEWRAACKSNSSRINPPTPPGPSAPPPLQLLAFCLLHLFPCVWS